MANPGFELFISDLFLVYDRMVRERPVKRLHVIAAGKHALAILRNYKPDDEGEEILIETAIEQFEELVRRAGGTL